MKKIFRSPRGRVAAAAMTSLVIGCAALTGCSTNASPAESQDGELASIKAIVAPIAFEPAYIAQRKGFFKEAGLEVEIIPGADAQANFAQALSGAVDIVTTSWTVMATSNAEGVPVSVIAGNGYINPEKAQSGIVVPADSEIKSYSDLAGKTLGVLGVRSGSDLAVMLAAEDNGVKPDDIVQVAVPYAGMQAAVEQGSIDAGMVVDPYYSQMLNAGLKSIGTPQSEYTANVPVTVWAATDQWVQSHAGTAEKFTAAMEKAAAYYNDPANAEEVRAITAEINGTNLDKVPKTLSAISVSLDQAAASKNLDDLSRLGYTTREVSYADVVWDGAPVK